MIRKRNTNKRTSKEQAELERLFQEKFNSPVWSYFIKVKRIRRPFNIDTDFERPDDWIWKKELQ